MLKKQQQSHQHNQEKKIINFLPPFSETANNIFELKSINLLATH